MNSFLPIDHIRCFFFKIRKRFYFGYSSCSFPTQPPRSVWQLHDQQPARIAAHGRLLALSISQKAPLNTRFRGR